jgi:hypothetical protein
MTGEPSLARRRPRFELRWPRPTKWLFGSLLAVDVALLLIALAFTNVTADGPAKRTLAQSVAILTEVDTFLDEHYPSLQLDAKQTSDTKVSLRDFPLAVTFSPQEINNTTRGQFRALLLERSAALLHDKGMSAFRDGRSSETSSLSPQGAVRASLDLLRPTPHRVFLGVAIALAVTGAALAAVLARSTRGYDRLAALGMSLSFAALPFLILAIALHFALRVAAGGTDDYLARELLQLGEQLAWAPIRDGIIVSAGGAALLAVGSSLSRWSDRTKILARPSTQDRH